MALHIAVLKGGWSSEREVSLNSGAACAKALRDAGYKVTEIDVTRDLEMLVKNLTPRPDAVFNVLHGKGGEDGVIQGVLAMLDLPVTHSGLLASAIAMDKQKTKEILIPHGMPCAAGGLVPISAIRAGQVPVDPPYVIKPNAEGSSVGVYIVRAGDNKPPMGLDKWSFGDHALVEKFIPGRELSVAVIGSEGGKPRALTVTEIKTQNSFYDYEAKYAEGGSSHVLPAPISQEVFDEALRLAELAHAKLGCAGVSRTDFRYDDSKPGAAGLCFIETNTQPGMTATSLVPEQAAHVGISFAALADWLVQDAVSRHGQAHLHSTATPAPVLPAVQRPAMFKKSG